MAWLWWLGGAAVLALLEIVSLDLVLIMFAGGALAAAGMAALGAPVWVQILAFLVTSGLLLFALRPWLLRSLRSRMTLTETNAAAQVGRMAVVLEDVTELHGRIKLAGEVWSARTRTRRRRSPWARRCACCASTARPPSSGRRAPRRTGGHPQQCDPRSTSARTSVGASRGSGR